LHKNTNGNYWFITINTNGNYLLVTNTNGNYLCTNIKIQMEITCLKYNQIQSNTNENYLHITILLWDVGAGQLHKNNTNGNCLLSAIETSDRNI
jgi:hypothetical protein